jgi:hypothetical protein
LRVEDIAVGQTLAGKGADADKTRAVLEIDRDNVKTEVFRNGQSLGFSYLHIRVLAQWASHVVMDGVR